MIHVGAATLPISGLSKPSLLARIPGGWMVSSGTEHAACVGDDGKADGEENGERATLELMRFHWVTVALLNEVICQD